jgi:hypothetical protein
MRQDRERDAPDLHWSNVDPNTFSCRPLDRVAVP